MTPATLNTNNYMFKRIRQSISIIILITFVTTSVKSPAYAQAAGVSAMPYMSQPGVMVHLSPEFTPAHLKGIVIHPENALKFDFIVYKGDEEFGDIQKKEEYTKLIKYFLASLAVPDEDQWVNLSPYEKDRIIKEDFGKTEMGRDLLAQDYMLKQITASLIYPEDNLGKTFWDKVYSQAQEQYGTTNIPVNTFNKVWIIPDDALIYEKGNTAYVLKNHLKVMLEEDYLSLKKHEGIQSAPVDNKTHSVASKIVKEIVLPELEKEVNEGKNFAALRQVYSGMLLAAWYKRALKESLLSKIYANKAKLKGVSQDNPQANEEIYQQYLKAYKKGVFNFIKEDVDKYSKESIPRKYFSGGTGSYDQAMATLHRDPLATTNRMTGGTRIQLGDEMPRNEVVAVLTTESGEPVEIRDFPPAANVNANDSDAAMMIPTFKYRYPPETLSKTQEEELRAAIEEWRADSGKAAEGQPFFRITYNSVLDNKSISEKLETVEGYIHQFTLDKDENGGFFLIIDISPKGTGGYINIRQGPLMRLALTRDYHFNPSGIQGAFPRLQLLNNSAENDGPVVLSVNNPDLPSFEPGFGQNRIFVKLNSERKGEDVLFAMRVISDEKKIKFGDQPVDRSRKYQPGAVFDVDLKDLNIGEKRDLFSSAVAFNMSIIFPDAAMNAADIKEQGAKLLAQLDSLMEQARASRAIKNLSALEAVQLQLVNALSRVDKSTGNDLEKAFRDLRDVLLNIQNNPDIAEQSEADPAMLEALKQVLILIAVALIGAGAGGALQEAKNAFIGPDTVLVANPEIAGTTTAPSNQAAAIESRVNQEINGTPPVTNVKGDVAVSEIPTDADGNPVDTNQNTMDGKVNKATDNLGKVITIAGETASTLVKGSTVVAKNGSTGAINIVYQGLKTVTDQGGVDADGNPVSAEMDGKVENFKNNLGELIDRGGETTSDVLDGSTNVAEKGATGAIKLFLQIIKTITNQAMTAQQVRTIIEVLKLNVKTDRDSDSAKQVVFMDLSGKSQKLSAVVIGGKSFDTTGDTAALQAFIEEYLKNTPNGNFIISFSEQGVLKIDAAMTVEDLLKSVGLGSNANSLTAAIKKLEGLSSLIKRQAPANEPFTRAFNNFRDALPRTGFQFIPSSSNIANNTLVINSETGEVMPVLSYSRESDKLYVLGKVSQSGQMTSYLGDAVLIYSPNEILSVSFKEMEKNHTVKGTAGILELINNRKVPDNSTPNFQDRLAQFRRELAADGLQFLSLDVLGVGSSPTGPLEAIDILTGEVVPVSVENRQHMYMGIRVNENDGGFIHPWTGETFKESSLIFFSPGKSLTTPSATLSFQFPPEILTRTDFDHLYKRLQGLAIPPESRYGRHDLKRVTVIYRPVGDKNAHTQAEEVKGFIGSFRIVEQSSESGILGIVDYGRENGQYYLQLEILDDEFKVIKNINLALIRKDHEDPERGLIGIFPRIQRVDGTAILSVNNPQLPLGPGFGQNRISIASDNEVFGDKILQIMEGEIKVPLDSIKINSNRVEKIRYPAGSIFQISFDGLTPEQIKGIFIGAQLLGMKISFPDAAMANNRVGEDSEGLLLANFEESKASFSQEDWDALRSYLGSSGQWLLINSMNELPIFQNPIIRIFLQELFFPNETKRDMNELMRLVGKIEKQIPNTRKLQNWERFRPNQRVSIEYIAAHDNQPKKVVGTLLRINKIDRRWPASSLYLVNIRSDGEEGVTGLTLYTDDQIDTYNMGPRRDLSLKRVGYNAVMNAADTAMSAQEEARGGIDFNAANLNLQIKRDGQGVPLPIAQQDWENIHIDGLIPVILDIKPAMETPLLSQLEIAKEPELVKV